MDYNIAASVFQHSALVQYMSGAIFFLNIFPHTPAPSNKLRVGPFIVEGISANSTLRYSISDDDLSLSFTQWTMQAI